MLIAKLETRRPTCVSGIVGTPLTTSSASPSSMMFIIGIAFSVSSGSSDLRERFGERSPTSGEANLDIFCWTVSSSSMAIVQAVLEAVVVRV